jgi:cation/acetate symporter
VVSGAPVVEATGKSPSLFQNVDFHWFPLNNPGLVSIPLSFFLGWLGTKLSKERPDELKTAELEVRAFTGIGAEKAVQH